MRHGQLDGSVRHASSRILVDNVCQVVPVHLETLEGTGVHSILQRGEAIEGVWENSKWRENDNKQWCVCNECEGGLVPRQ